jgi:hypothetical protein
MVGVYEVPFNALRTRGAWTTGPQERGRREAGERQESKRGKRGARERQGKGRGKAGERQGKIRG